MRGLGGEGRRGREGGRGEGKEEEERTEQKNATAAAVANDLNKKNGAEKKGFAGDSLRTMSLERRMVRIDGSWR